MQSQTLPIRINRKADRKYAIQIPTARYAVGIWIARKFSVECVCSSGEGARVIAEELQKIAESINPRHPNRFVVEEL